MTGRAARKAPHGPLLGVPAPPAIPVAMASPFMSIDNFKHISGVAARYLSEIGISSEVAEASGIRMDRLVYKAMADADADASLSTAEKNRMTVEIVAGFMKGVSLKDPAPAVEAEGDIRPTAGDPYVEFRKSLERPGTRVGSDAATAGAPPGHYGSEADYIIQRSVSVKKRTVSRFVLVSGRDRHWVSHPSRFRFTVDMASGGSAVRNIRSVAATRLIIPREIVEEASVTNVPKSRFDKPFGLHHPYLILTIDELQGVYHATNAESRTAFAHFVFDKEHVTPSGRGYIHLVPMQEESKTFDITPLSSMDKLTLGVKTPFGDPLNSSVDVAGVLRMDWNNQVNMNTQLIMVTTVDYFDRNEFYPGDFVRFDGFLTKPGAPLDSFVNRYSGHEIVETGAPNPDGYVQGFYIRAPGSFNPATGTFEVDTGLMSDLMAYTGGLVGAPLASICVAINSSLQITVSLKLGVEEDDFKV